MFYSYCLQLVVRFKLGIVLAVFQNYLFYSKGFPTEFICILPTVKPTVNSTVLNTSKHDAPATINCYTSVGSDNATWARGIWIVNILLAVLVCAELTYILVQAKQKKQFMFVSEFCRKYFFNKNRTPITLHEHTLRMKRRVCNETEFLEPLIA